MPLLFWLESVQSNAVKELDFFHARSERKGSGVKLFSLVAINEETFNLDDLVEDKVHIEILVGKGIPTSRALIRWVIFKGRLVYFRPIQVSAGTRVGQPNEMWLL